MPENNTQKTFPLKIEELYHDDEPSGYFSQGHHIATEFMDAAREHTHSYGYDEATQTELVEGLDPQRISHLYYREEQREQYGENIVVYCTTTADDPRGYPVTRLEF